LKRLITTQLDHLSGRSGNDRYGEDEDLNEYPGKRNQKKNQDGYHRYFINIGTIDGVTESDLIHFISDISGIGRKYFGEISLQKNYSFFNVDKDYDRGLSDRFTGIEIEGRSIRVNRDEDRKTSRTKDIKKRNHVRVKNRKRNYHRSGKIRR
jgi:ATP-dependent RNA helicase DeaD